MKAVSLIVGLAIGLALSLTVAVGVAWYFMRTQNAGPIAAGATTSETVPNDARAGGGGGAAGGNNVRVAKFAELDTDHQDGKLTLAEFGVGRKPAEAARWFAKRDTDNDGFISREEFLPFSAGPKAQ